MAFAVTVLIVVVIGLNHNVLSEQDLDLQHVGTDFMNYSKEKIANEFLEISSEQRLAIILKLDEKKSKISTMAKELDATVPEVFRNFERLANAGLVRKDSDGYYDLTTYGKTLCSQVSSLVFISKNKKYFEDHSFGDIPQKFIHRIGELASGQYVKGFVKVLEKWQEIYKNANGHISNILAEVPYTLDLLEPLVANAKKGVKINSIISESAIIPKGRKEIFDKLGFKKLIEKGVIERRMIGGVKVVVVLNEKEACIMFPTASGEVDMTSLFFSSDPTFHDWCLDYFRYCWENSSVFQESKIRE